MRLRSRIGGLLLAFALSMVPLKGAFASEPVAVIVNKDNVVKALSEGDLRKIYTNNILNWPDGAPIIIYDLAVQNQLRGLFSSSVLEKDPERVAEEWAHLKITNQAKNPPVTMKSEALIIRRVSTEKGAIGYVSLNAAKLNPDVRIIYTIR